MAWEYPKSAICGHDLPRVQIMGPGPSRKAQYDRACNKACDECIKARVTEQEQHQPNNWPTLVGTDRQVAWAIDLRAQFSAKLEAGIVPADHPQSEEIRRYGTLALQKIVRAAWWIDNRGSADHIVKVMYDHEHRKVLA